ncbi:MAG TPA: DHA2 family efflux MFS transporter permease subunit [Polyangia bacterium]|nr:DHA2 family efflux MFS transporter permease subunit [Polyangia bacterium]
MSGDPRHEAADDALHEAPFEGRLLRLILIVTFGPLLLNLSSTTINVAIDKLMVDLRAPLSVVQWVVTGYLLALTLVLPAFRWAVERVGSRRLYVACLLGFTATSALSALAWSAPSLIAFRVLQGAVGGLLAPLTQTLIAQLAGPKRMGRAVSIISVPFLVAPLFGPTLGGFLIERLSWRWLFLFNVPLGLCGAWLAHRRLPPGETVSRTRLDLVGLALLSPGIALFTYGLSALGHAQGALTGRALLPLAAALFLVTAFVLHARRRPATALLDLNVFRHRAVGASLVIYLLTSFSSFGGQFILPLYYQQARGESPTHAGMLIAAQGLGMLLTLPQIGKLTDRVDHGKLVMLGVLATLIGTYAFTQATDHTSYLLLSAALVIRGAGLGATNTPALAAAYRNLARDEIPNATATLNIVQRLGAPLGVATMVVALQRFAPARRTPALLARAFAHTFALSAILSALALFAALALIRSNTSERSPA